MEALDTHFINCVVSRGGSFPFAEAQGFFLLLAEFAMCCPLEEVSLHHRITKIFSHFFGKVYSFGFYI